jgi:hypothetical protein
MSSKARTITTLDATRGVVVQAVVHKARRLVLAADGEVLDATYAIRCERQTQARRARRR